ncbi:hypothetical protein BGZ60DRAFT_4823 [Tricladium varicosporioides]|nr:hypothetical protein BGZ60DRAFT_4823 [Hymenoscyphus varicosporioides]
MEQQSNFLFIQETGYGPQVPETRSQIKMHVMDRVVSGRQRKRVPGIEEKSDKTQTSMQSLARERRKGKNLQNIPSRVQRKNNNDNSHLISPEVITLENMLRLSGREIGMTPMTRFLLHHFLQFRSKSLCTVSLETGWLTYALEDAALLNSTLYHWALLNYYALPDKFRKEDQLLTLKGESIRMINSRLSNIGQKRVVGDEVIAAIACLASVNVWKLATSPTVTQMLTMQLILGNVEEANMHFGGLNAIVRSRGGIHTLGYQGLIARLVKWTDSCHAQISKKKLLVEEKSTILTDVQQSNHAYIQQPSHFQLTKSHIIARLHRISCQLIETSREELSKDDRIDLGLNFLASDRELLDFMHNSSDKVLSIVATAALIYSQAILRGLNRDSRMVQSLIGQLKDKLIAVFNSDWDAFAEDPAALTWVLLIAVVLSEVGGADHGWFIRCLRRIGDGDHISLQKLESTIETPTSPSPQPFHWLLDVGDLQRLYPTNAQNIRAEILRWKTLN